MDQQRLFALMPPMIDVTLAVDEVGRWSVTILDRPAGVPWGALDPQRYEHLTADELLDVLAAHLASLA